VLGGDRTGRLAGLDRGQFGGGVNRPVAIKREIADDADVQGGEPGQQVFNFGA